jgi:hypothetical protein
MLGGDDPTSIERRERPSHLPHGPGVSEPTCVFMHVELSLCVWRACADKEKLGSAPREFAEGRGGGGGSVEDSDDTVRRRNRHPLPEEVKLGIVLCCFFVTPQAKIFVSSTLEAGLGASFTSFDLLLLTKALYLYTDVADFVSLRIGVGCVPPLRRRVG